MCVVELRKTTRNRYYPGMCVVELRKTTRNLSVKPVFLADQ